MKLTLLLIFVLLLAGPVVVHAQEKFTVYEKSSTEARKQWDAFLKKEPGTPRFYLIVKNADNAYDRSLAYLVQAMQTVNGDSARFYLNQSVLTVRDELDTNRYELPLEIQNTLATKFYNNRGFMLDGMADDQYRIPWQCSYFIQEKEELCRLKNDEWRLAEALARRATVYSQILNLNDRAMPLLDSAVSIRRKLGRKSPLADCLLRKGIVSVQMKKYPDAEAEIKEAIDLFEQDKIPYLASICQLELVLLYAKAGEPDSMKKYDQLCRPIFEENDTFFLFMLNNYCIAAYQSFNQDNICDFVKQNGDLLADVYYDPGLSIDYYKYSIEAFTFFGLTELKKKYESDFEKLKNELLKRGYWPGLFQEISGY